MAERGPRASGTGHRASGTGSRRRGPGLSGQIAGFPGKIAKIDEIGPHRLWARTSAMFFTNNMVKNDMVVSRETLLIFW